MKVRVTRPVLWDGQVQPVGAVLDLDARDATTLQSFGKAEPVAGEPPPAPPGPMTTETAGELTGKGRRKT